MRDTNSPFNKSMLVYPSKLHLFSLAPLLTVSFRVCNMRNIHSSLNGSIGTSILAASSQLCSMGDTNSSFLCSTLIGTSLTTTLLLCCALCKTKTGVLFFGPRTKWSHFLCVIFFGGKAGTVWSLELGLELGLTRDHLVPRLVGGMDHY